MECCFKNSFTANLARKCHFIIKRLLQIWSDYLTQTLALMPCYTSMKLSGKVNFVCRWAYPSVFCPHISEMFFLDPLLLCSVTRFSAW